MYLRSKILAFSFVLVSCLALNSYAAEHDTDIARGGGGGHGGGGFGGGHGGFDRGFDRGFEDRGAVNRGDWNRDAGYWDGGAGGLYYYNGAGYNNYPGYYPYYQGGNADADVDQIYLENQRSMEQGG